jgi:thiol-disulfide isomerase/thioredoxin
MKKLLKFEASWCNPCKAMDNVLEQVKDLFEITHIDIEGEDSQDMVLEYRIMSVPTIIILNEEGDVDARIVGTCDVEHLKGLA